MKVTSPIRSLAIIVAGLFLSEVIVMGVVAQFNSWSYASIMFLDAILLILLATPLLYFFFARPFYKTLAERDTEIEQRRQAESKLKLQTTALETAANGVIITDRNGTIVWVNKAFAEMSGYSVEEVIGKNPRLLNSGRQKAEFFTTMWRTILSGEVWHGEVINRRKGGSLYVDEQTITPVLDASGEIEYFIAIQQDVTEHKQAEGILKARLHLMQFALSHTMDELLRAALDDLESLTDSEVGFFHFLEDDGQTIRLQAWSTNTIQNMCKAVGPDNHYPVEQAGVWADCVRLGEPVVHNDYLSLKHRKGLPEGHPPVIRELAVPIKRDGKIVAILGVGNKPHEYGPGDVNAVSTLADFAWDIIERKQAETVLRESEERFRTLANWTFDLEKWIDPQDNIIYISPSCERITGYRPEEFIADPNLLRQIIHPEDLGAYNEHSLVVHDETAGVKNIEYRLIAKDGSEHWIDHICRPLYGANGRYLGRRVSDRDITERKRAEKEIEERNQREEVLNQTIHSMQIDLARDLHDTIGQNISYLRMKLDNLSDTSVDLPTSTAEEIRLMRDVADDSYELLRGFLALLQTDTSASPLKLFSKYSEKITERSRVNISIISHGTPRTLSAATVRQLFFIFRESLNNIEKHSRASEGKVEFRWGKDSFEMTISDNGHGFDSTASRRDGHYGLKFMRERSEQIHGLLDVHSSPDTGTKIILRVPLENGNQKT